MLKEFTTCMTSSVKLAPLLSFLTEGLANSFKRLELKRVHFNYRISAVNMPFYAVARGKETGVFLTWSECQAQILGFKGAVFKKFPSKEEADTFVQERKGKVVDKRKPAPDDEADGKEEPKSKPTKRKAEQEKESSKKLKTVEIVKDGGKMSFNADDEGFVIIYTDGACGFNGRQGAKAGIGVYFGPDHPLNVSEPVMGRATNNIAEIQAAKSALELAKDAGFDKVIINTDSQFMINCMTSWMPGWKKRGWKKSDGSQVVNKEDLILLDKSSEGLVVKWNHVDGHSGIPGNEAADQLAREGAKRYKVDSS